MRYIILLIIIMTLIVLPVMPAYADQSNPDSPPTLVSMDVYRNLLESGDRLYIWEANTPYATTPNATFPEAFIWRLFDTDNTTELGQTTGYSYNADGYGYNIFGMYFDAADNLTWDAAYILRLSGNPAIFNDPPIYNFQVNTGDYTSFNGTTDNKVALSEKVLALAADLDNRWGLATAYSLLLESEAGTYLSIYGEAVFRGSIYGIQALAPYAFRLQMTDIEIEDRTWNTEYAENLTTQFQGTWIDPAKTAGGTLFGVGYDLTSIIISMVLAVGLVFANTKLTSDPWNAMVDVGILLVALPRIDMIPLSFTALVCAIFVMYEGTRIKSMIG